ncbi:TldD/PmbA family protein [Oleispirillum naphthae]|uniref:TldD/PmbA family protein n=1 Tax=Oleispirillum naphthae TaxID=2838853 RepID=UPI0030825A47
MSEAGLNRLEDVLKLARACGADAADAVYGDGRSLSLAVRKGRLEKLERAEGAEIGLRVFLGRRAALVSTSDFSAASLKELAERAVAMARVMPEDPFAGLASPEQLMRGALPECDLCDPAEATEDELIAAAHAAEDAALAVAGVSNSEGAEASVSRSEIALAATNGFSHGYCSSHAALAVSVLAGGADGMERDYDSAVAVYRADLPAPESLGRAAGERAVARLGAKKAASATLPVVFDPRVSRSLLSHFLGAVNGASVARGTSFLADAMGGMVFAPGVSIVEDPHRVRGLRSRPCDAEGLPTARRALIDGGRLTSWLLDLRAARQLGLAPTGHAARGIGSAPSPSAANVALLPGTLSPAAMIGGISRGLYVTELIGSGVNGVTGDYSRGAAGFLIENGEKTRPVNEVTIAGNLREMFARLVPADDWVYRYGMDAPTVCIDGMTLAGA